MKIDENIRTASDEFFKLSGIREWKKLSHTPILIIRPKEILLCYNGKDLIENYLDSDLCLMQWGGKYSSDYFKFDVLDFKLYIKMNPKENYHII